MLRTALSRTIKLSIIFSLKLLLFLVKIEKPSKHGEKLQHERCSWITVSLLLLIFTIFPMNCKKLKCSQIRTLKWRWSFHNR